MDTNAAHSFNVGDAVMADMNGAMIPGVIEDRQGDLLVVRLAQPWTDETGRQTQSVTLPADRLGAQLDQGTTGPRALPD